MRVRREVIEAMVTHARAEAPFECCGLLLGREDVIDECRPARNLRRSASTYEVDPHDHFAAIRAARQTGRAVTGAYHSHPRSPAVPSPTDVAEAFDTSLLYVIVSLAGVEPDVRGYRIFGGNFNEVSLVPQA
jgi:proteasome lid subunit RPN8/RPN11